MKIESIKYENGKIILIDQRKLPLKFEEFICESYRDVEFAIRDMVVRGAPAIGATAALGIVLAMREFLNRPLDEAKKEMNKVANFIENARPTAVNLTWAIEIMMKFCNDYDGVDTSQLFEVLEQEAIKILKDDFSINKKMAENGNTVIQTKATILTHCNTGALATAGYGTALGVIREAFYTGKDIFVYADETRPRLQGARLTAWELVQEKIPAKLIADNTAATLIRDKKIDLILVGADRIAANGDTANKIGTFMLSVIASVYNVPFYIVAPTSTIDQKIKTGKEIKIEERDKKEIIYAGGCQIAPLEIDVYNPAFDVTPYQNITGIITEKGIIYPPFNENISKIKGEK